MRSYAPRVGGCIWSAVVGVSIGRSGYDRQQLVRGWREVAACPARDMANLGHSPASGQAENRLGLGDVGTLCRQPSCTSPRGKAWPGVQSNCDKMTPQVSKSLVSHCRCVVCDTPLQVVVCASRFSTSLYNRSKCFAVW